MELGMELLTERCSRVAVARASSRVYKDECIYSFDNPESEKGLYVSLESFLGVGHEFMPLHLQTTGEQLYLNIRRWPKPKDANLDEPPTKKPTRLAIGLEGGFSGGVEKVEYEEELKVVILPGGQEVPLPNPKLPSLVRESIDSVMKAESVGLRQDIVSWEAGKRKVTRHAYNLVQLEGIKIPPSGWKCEECDATTNLWLNLTDGSILCGRKYFDGSGGNNHALERYKITFNPLVVKLGTITPSGADVFSYDEDDMVEDPCIGEHLANLGINMMAQTKTEKTMTELEIEMNMKIGEWSIIQESGKELKLLYGPGYTGMENLGNSCYMNSVMQVLFSIPEFGDRYYNAMYETFTKLGKDVTEDFNAQMCKLACGLLSGRYSQPPSSPTPPPAAEGESPLQREQKGISPRTFKALIGKGHQEFRTNRQQDAQEFFLHLLSTIDRVQRTSHGSTNMADLFRYEAEERVQCTVSGKVSYSRKPELILTLPIPMEMATNKAEVDAWEERKQKLQEEKKKIPQDEAVRARVPFSLCLDKYAASAEIPDFYSTAVGAKSPAVKTSRLATFPDYLMVQLAKFSFGKDWVPVKYDVEVDVPHELDLTHLRGLGLRPEEEELPPQAEETPQLPAAKPVEIDEETVMQLVGMGFSLEGCRRAVFKTGNSGVEAAMEWVLEHSSDPDFNEPFQPQAQAAPPVASGAPSDDDVAMIVALGFSREQALRALKATGNNVERAADWVFSHAEELDAPEESSEPTKAAKNLRDGPGKYRLMAFISHMGTSTMSGHYVCHIFKEGRWVIFNDNKVAQSVAPPKDLAYLYLYKRETTDQ